MKTYNFISNIVPNASRPSRAPLRSPTNIPSQQRIAGPTFSRNPSRFEFREVGLEEADLVFSVYGRGIGIIMHDCNQLAMTRFGGGEGERQLRASWQTDETCSGPVKPGTHDMGQRNLFLTGEVVPYSSLIDCCCCLGNQFRSAHGLAIPKRGAIQGEFGSLGTTCIGRILVRGVQIDVRSYGTGTMLLGSASGAGMMKENSRYSIGTDQLDLTKTMTRDQSWL
jgi:hypothetical protein